MNKLVQTQSISFCKKYQEFSVWRFHICYGTQISRCTGCNHRFLKFAKPFGLKIDLKKTKFMYQLLTGSHDNGQDILIEGQLRTKMKEFKYLRSAVANSRLDGEQYTRTLNASKAFRRLRTRLLFYEDLSMKTKFEVYHATVSSTLLFFPETWTMLRKTGCALVEIWGQESAKQNTHYQLWEDSSKTGWPKFRHKDIPERNLGSWTTHLACVNSFLKAEKQGKKSTECQRRIRCIATTIEQLRAIVISDIKLM